MVIRTTLDEFYIAPFQVALGDFLGPVVAHGGVAVEIGCGQGAATESLRALGFTALGFDLDPDRIAAARTRFPGCDFRVADVTSLPLADGSCDLVFSCSVLQYVDHRRTLAECRRILRPGGRAIFIENLVGHPLARLDRRWRRRARASMPTHRVPTRHVDLAGLDMFAEYLDVTSVHTANLLTPLALVPQALLRRSTIGHATGFQRLLSAADQRLLAWRPALARYCWTVLVCAVARG